ncbi:MAG TPA: sugar transferase [Thermoflexus sp.]|nr:sugar transferase [Thermoflexus sp.]
MRNEAMPSEFIRLSARTEAREAEWIGLRIGLILMDAIALAIAFSLSYLIRFESRLPIFYQPESQPAHYYGLLMAVLIPVWLLVFAAHRLYAPDHLFHGTSEYMRVIQGASVGMMAAIVASFMEPALVIARGWLLLSWALSIGMVGLARFLARRVVYALRARGKWMVPALIVGADEEARMVAEQLRSSPISGMILLGVLDPQLPRGKEVMPGLPVLGTLTDLPRLIEQLGVREVIVSASALPREALVELFRSFAFHPQVNLRLSSGLYELLATGTEVREVMGVPLLYWRRLRLSPLEQFLKAVMDYTLTAVALFLLAPVFLLIALAIKLDSPGPVLYRRRVVGLGGKLFDAFKFRTMVVNAEALLEQNPALKEAFQQNYKLKDDPRVTRVGRFLRRWSLDELPQLFNVLRGEMSLVGPRMLTPEEISRYGRWALNLLTVKPGITGLWQVSGRADLPYSERVRLDLFYIRNYSLWLDLAILAQTIPAVIRKRGAY